MHVCKGIVERVKEADRSESTVRMWGGTSYRWLSQPER